MVAILAHRVSNTKLAANLLEQSAVYHDAALAPTGFKKIWPSDESVILFGTDKSSLPVLKLDHGAGSSNNSMTIRFAAPRVAELDALNAAELSNGGAAGSAAGSWDHLPSTGAFAAYLRGPAGNKFLTCPFINGN